MIKNEKTPFYFNDISGNNTIEEQKQQYVDVLCTSKKSNITKENIGEILLCQIPSVSKAIAKRIMGEYKTIRDLISVLEDDPEILKDIKIKDNNGKERKVNSTALKNIKDYLVLNKS